MNETFALIIAFIIGVGGVLSAFIAWIPLANFIKGQKSDTESRAISEGERREILKDIRKDVDSLWNKSRDLESRVSETQKNMIEMQSDLKHLVKAVDSILTKLP